MLDDFRAQADSATFFGQDEDLPPLEQEEVYETRKPFLGMTAFQRFLVALMLLLITFLLSSVCLLVSGRISLPFV